MDTGIRKLSNLILYSSLWIAACAAAQVQFTYDVVGINPGFDYYTVFVFASTLVLYSFHRIVGIRRVKAFEDVGRFAVISKYRSHIIFYGLLGLAAAVYFVFQLPVRTWLFLGLPLLISGAYVVPFKAGKMRLRDVPFIKIFLIAASWSLLTTTVPLLHNGYTGNHLATIFIERFLFIIAITIPFDIRDYDVDQQASVPTLPHILGLQKSRFLALIVLALSMTFTVFLVRNEIYASDLLMPYVLVMLFTGLLIVRSKPNMDDHFYSGLLDGVMFLAPFFYWVWSQLS